MQRWPRIAIVWLLCAIVATACSPAPLSSTDPSLVPSPPPAATAPVAAPTPAAELVFMAESYIAGIDVSGLTLAAAGDKLRTALAVAALPLDLRVGDRTITLRPDEIGLEVPIEQLLVDARGRLERGESVRLPLEMHYDDAALRTRLSAIAEQVKTPPTLSVITATKTISRSFVYEPGKTLDLDRAVEQIDQRLRSLQGTRRVTLSLTESTDAPKATFADIQTQVEAMVKEWNGIVGFYLYDLQTGETVMLNEDTVFSAASVMKVPIMLQSYIALEQFDTDQRQWMTRMIVDSDNLAANKLLAASVDGQGTEDALTGALEMTEMLQKLGMEHTYQYMPYEAGDYLIKVRKMKIRQGPEREGSPPYTEADPVLRTTPAEMGRIFVLIDQCSQGNGELLAQFDKTLSAKRCQEMLSYLERNADTKRLVAGLPKGTRVAHKSGWIDDMQADVGIVRTPGGDFVLGVYVYKDVTTLPDEVAMPAIAAFSRLVYTAYNPVLKR